VTAIDRLRRHGIAVYNQLVYTFYVSRCFEAARLRLLLKRCGVDPYYTFAPKGKAETRAYRVPLARLLQEQKEEARLLPGLRRTDEVVYNVPGLGKNHLRAFQHRDLVSILPDGARVYELHPWEDRGTRRQPYIGTDVPIYEYLTLLAASGETPEDYGSIWYYF
jgi:lysine 2,3-aminomutase